MVQSFNLDQCMLLRKAFALNNFGVSLMGRKNYSQALSTFEDALKVIKVVADESFCCIIDRDSNCMCSTSHDQTHKDNLYSSQPSRGPQEENLVESQLGNIEHDTSNDDENKIYTYYGNSMGRLGGFRGAHNFADGAIRAAPQRLASCPPISEALLNRREMMPCTQSSQFYRRGNKPIEEDKKKAGKTGFRGVVGNNAGTRTADVGRNGMLDFEDLQVVCTYSYIEGHGLFQSNLHFSPENDEKPAQQTLFQSIWIDTMLSPEFDHLSYGDHQHPCGRETLNGEISEKGAAENDSRLGDEINVGAAIVTFNLAITCLCLFKKFREVKRHSAGKKLPTDQHKLRSTTGCRERLSLVGFRTLDLVLEVLYRVSDCEGSNTNVHTLTTLYFLVYRTKQHAYALFAQQDESERNRKCAEYYGEIVERIDVFLGGVGLGKVLAPAA